MLNVTYQNPTKSNKPREMRILLVEDNDFIRISTMLMFHELGHYPDDALNGREALDLVKSKVYDTIHFDRYWLARYKWDQNRQSDSCA